MTVIYRNSAAIVPYILVNILIDHIAQLKKISTGTAFAEC